MTVLKQKKIKNSITNGLKNGLERDIKTLGNLPFDISLWNILGIITCLFCGGYYSYLICQLHDARVFFSGIKEVERDISFRTENGLYYSYYKQLVKSSSLIDGIFELMNDKLTEHPSKINILARMNIYQEVFLAIIYRTFLFWTSLEPVFFYIYSIFALHALLVYSLFILTWNITGSWLYGFITYLFYVLNSVDTTRVDMYMPLRENFSLPFLWLQILFIHLYFSQEVSEYMKSIYKKALLISTFFFTLMWQFNQFALLLQSMALFGCQILHLVDHQKIIWVYICQIVSLFIVSILQFFNLMILSGFLISFIFACILILKIQKFSIWSYYIWTKILCVPVFISLVFILAFLFNSITKFISLQESDEHINKFVMTKFGFDYVLNFDVRLYLCNGGFSFLTIDFFERLTTNFVFPLYFIAHLTLFGILLLNVFSNYLSLKVISDRFHTSIRPEMAYHTIQIVFFGAVAVMAMRMKYFWTPYICVFGSIALSASQPWLWLSEKFIPSFSKKVPFVKNAIVVLIVATLLANNVPGIVKELNDLREFYDPDTVELMEWIIDKTPKNSSFTGSMQLLAGVKLCTERPITNHPHYEDKGLRIKTKDLYKIYGRFNAETVHKMLLKYQTDYIILEDSICLVAMKDGCGLPYIMDMESGIELDSKGFPLSTDVEPRFCYEIRYKSQQFSSLFKEVFLNKTFRVYAVLKEA